jgi:TatD DNase family protein
MTAAKKTVTARTTKPRKAPALAYRYRKGLYINLTSRCPTACVFCIKIEWEGRYRGYNLRLGGKEPSVKKILAAVAELAPKRPFNEIIFCGYGEPTYRLPALIEIAKTLRERYPRVRFRMNSIGLGNLIWGRDIAPELKTAIDAVCISLNTADPERWRRIHKPIPAFRDKGFDGVLDFIGACSRAGLDTVVTAVDVPGVDVPALRRIARRLGARLRLRPKL